MSIAIEKNKLLSLRLSLIADGYDLRIKMQGGSMFPYLRKGDIALIRKVNFYQLCEGDIIAFETEGKWIAHRILKKINKNDKKTFLCKGDAMKNHDPLVAENNYLGKIIGLERNNQFINIDTDSRKKLHYFLAKISPFTPYLYRVLKKLIKN